MSAPFELVGLDHVVILVHGMDEASDFYTKVIGCSVDNDLPEYAMRQLRAGSGLIDLVDVDTPEGEWARPPVAGGRNVDHVALALGPADKQAVRQHLARHRISIEEEGDNIGSRGRSLSFYVRDPSGNLVELSFAPSA
jgi:catechol 2,3-dioxygenase-like lactoylglutathione lyase family enzyme